ncbi:tyrosine-type recombinase/integrase [Asaccharospora irregularis]|uniref:Site-specific recombinase XerD n=1 Tax=Asaccharospora irregularis DSM 2635 TaxID=1121321 RepID=A0A1M5NMN5_9FIRM|nr:tyrosine-type recombinase/integrase [Asaccharospora irregularis]SHG90816.1 Site-specific recombinase XerD [Asaccharospora irregularis DSM 2635]
MVNNDKKDNHLDDYEYELFNLFSRRQSPATKLDYLSKITLFKSFIDSKELIYANKEDCSKFIEAIRSNYAKSTCEKIYSYLHSFYNFLKKEEYIEINPFIFVEKPVVTRIKNKDDVLSIQEINQLVSIFPKLTIRDRSIIVCLITTGCLLSELVRLRWKDIIINSNDIAYIRLGKGKKEREIKLHPYLLKLLMEYRNYSGLPSEIDQTHDFIFTTQKSDFITDRNVRLIVKRALDLAGLSQYSARDFRHSFAAINLSLGMEKEDVKDKLGWSDKSYAVRYKYVINFVDEDILYNSQERCLDEENHTISEKNLYKIDYESKE